LYDFDVQLFGKYLLEVFLERMQNEKKVKENPTKLEYVLRCFLKVKAICKNKKKCSGSGADVSVH
jgi:hypothetical protein